MKATYEFTMSTYVANSKYSFKKTYFAQEAKALKVDVGLF